MVRISVDVTCKHAFKVLMLDDMDSISSDWIFL